MFSTNAVMNIWLKSLGTYSIPQISYIPAGVSAVGICMTLALGWYSDITKKKWHVGKLIDTLHNSI
jgi:ACS family pantothenate transporter-like MFS transporter